MRETLEKQLARFDELERMMSDPVVLGDSSKIAAVAREHGSLSKVATKYRRFKDTLEEVADLKKMSESPDSDERAMANEELLGVRERRETLWNELLEQTLGGEDANRTR